MEHAVKDAKLPQLEGHLVKDDLHANIGEVRCPRPPSGVLGLPAGVLDFRGRPMAATR
jgi:hypothetical protein